MAKFPQGRTLYGRKTGKIVGVECRGDRSYAVVRVTETIFGTSHLVEVKLPGSRMMPYSEMVDHIKTVLG